MRISYGRYPHNLLLDVAVIVVDIMVSLNDITGIIQRQYFDKGAPRIQGRGGDPTGSEDLLIHSVCS